MPSRLTATWTTPDVRGNETTPRPTLNADNRVVKSGLGTLTLGNANSYIGGTSVDGGTLLVNNTTGSGTGTGTVIVNA